VAADRETALERMAAAIAEDPAVLVRVNAHHASRLGEVLALAGDVEALGAREVVLVITPPP
jgi:hypothetical protein